jgi:hypothetical protein
MKYLKIFENFNENSVKDIIETELNISITERDAKVIEKTIKDHDFSIVFLISLKAFIVKSWSFMVFSIKAFRLIRNTIENRTGEYLELKDISKVFRIIKDSF